MNRRIGWKLLRLLGLGFISVVSGLTGHISRGGDVAACVTCDWSEQYKFFCTSGGGWLECNTPTGSCQVVGQCN